MANQLTRKDRKRLSERQKQLDTIGKRDDNEIFLDQKRRIHRQITSLNVIEVNEEDYGKAEQYVSENAASRTQHRRQKNVSNILKEVYVTNNEAILNEDTNMRILKNLSLNANRTVELSPLRKVQFQEKQSKFDEITSELRFIIDELNTHKEGIAVQRPVSSSANEEDNTAANGIFDIETAHTAVNVFEDKKPNEYDELRGLISDTMQMPKPESEEAVVEAIEEPVDFSEPEVAAVELTQPIPTFVQSTVDDDPLSALLQKRRLEETGNVQYESVPTDTDVYDYGYEDDVEDEPDDVPSTQEFIANTAQMVFGALKGTEQAEELTNNYHEVSNDLNEIGLNEQGKKTGKMVIFLLVILGLLVVSMIVVVVLLVLQGNLAI